MKYYGGAEWCPNFSVITIILLESDFSKSRIIDKDFHIGPASTVQAFLCWKDIVENLRA